MKKIVFFDIDGTLLNSDKQIPASTKRAISQLKRNGVTIAIATGRTPFNIQFVLDALDIRTYVALNGGLVYHNNEVIHQTTIDPDMMSEIVQTVNVHNHALIQCGKTSFSLIGSNPDGYKREFLGRNWDLSKLIYGELQEPISQLELMCPEDDLDLYTSRFPKLQFHRWSSRPDASNVFPVTVSKAVGIQAVLDAVGATKEHAYAFGDGSNDREMLTYVGTGVAMGNAGEELKQLAAYVTKHVDDDGIEAGLTHLGLI